MIKTAIISLLLLSCISSVGQVLIHPKPEEGFERRIRRHVDTIRVVDTHEHLANPAGLMGSPRTDFMLLLHQYADDDIKSAGMSKPAFERLLTDSLTVQEKWEIVRPYWEKSSNTAYNRAVLITLQHIFGISDLNENTVVPLSQKIKEAYETDWYNFILKEKSRIRYVINDHPDRSWGDPEMFRYTQRFDYLRLDSKEKVEATGKKNGMNIRSLEDLEKCLELEFDAAIRKGFAAIKTAEAYHRPLHYEDVTREEAASALRAVMNNGEQPVSARTAKPLSDYMMHRILGLARKYDKPIQIHTGLQAGDGNFIQNSNPALLANLFLKYRDVRFVLLHGSYPYGGELATLAKNFRNVWLDMSWVHIISPSFSERYLHEWLETVPANKIMAFGGDYDNVENVYAHNYFARQVVANVLTEKVRNRYLSEQEAIKIASMIMFENAFHFYQLGQ